MNHQSGVYLDIIKSRPQVNGVVHTIQRMTTIATTVGEYQPLHDCSGRDRRFVVLRMPDTVQRNVTIRFEALETEIAAY